MHLHRSTIIKFSVKLAFNFLLVTVLLFLK